nr:D89 [uncultured bacterium]
MDLGAWNQRLAEHFSGLARDREDIPVFALEHGLAQAEVLALQHALRAHIQVSAPARNHQLVWVVYAAEIGYGYAGDEYWQTFEARTPGWTENGNRSWIRDAFVAFQKKFAAAKPTGPWAEHFSIIAWPITHAILPRDLQQQLARILYELRHSFSAELFHEPQRLGDFIAARSWSASARFRNLVQAPALVGQIAAALLLQGKEGFKTLLHPTTLKRIGDDVDRERRGREWLRGARHAAEERAKIRGLTIGRPTATTFERRDDARAEVVRLGIEPRLVLRPCEASCWEVSLEIPDLSHLLLRFPQVRDILTESRCTVTGAAGRPLARGRCLHGPQRVPLSRWPRPDDVLLKFERTDAQLEYLLRTECMLRPGTSWLFKVGSDGLAYESRGMRVRADSKYLLVSTEPFTHLRVARPVELTCQGVYAVLLDVPSALTPEWEQALEELQVSQAKVIEVWPAGLAAVAWDGEGHGEWLASETPILAIRSDHAIDELTIASGEGPSLSLSLTETPPGEPIFVQLQPLPVGVHNFSVAARSGSGAGSEVIGDLELVMRVREARPWSPGATARGPIEVELDPAAPSLEQLWEGKASIHIRGPDGRQAKARARMSARPGEAPLFERELPPITLPLSSVEWTRHFEAHLKKDKDAQHAYDNAHVCEVEFSADDLGGFTIHCEREFTPLRWSVRRVTAGFTARLHDNAGIGEPIVQRFSFERPTVGETLSAARDHLAPRAGGLYVATLLEFRASIVVPPIVNDFAQLRCEPQLDTGSRTVAHIVQLVRFARLWSSSRLSGDLIAGVRRRTVLRALTARISALLGGDRWGHLEDDFFSEEIGLATLRQAILSKNSSSRFDRTATDPAQIFPRDLLIPLGTAPLDERCAALVELIERLRLMPYSARGRPAASSLHPSNRRPALGDAPRARGAAWVAEFALRTASDPAALETWAGGDLEDGIKSLLEAPALARAARFLVLAVDQKQQSAILAGETYSGWRWSA